MPYHHESRDSAEAIGSKEERKDEELFHRLSEP